MPNLTKALLVAAALSCTALAGCTSTEDRKSETTAKSQAPAPKKSDAATHEESATQTLDDSVVTAKVKAKLVDDPVTKAYQINVETFKGTVQLSGFVDSAEAATRATSLAKDVGGVKDVKNSLQVRKSEG